MIGIVSWLTSTIFVLSVSYLAHRRLRTDRPAINVIEFLFLNIFVTTLFVVVAGVAGALKPLPLMLGASVGTFTLLALPSPRLALLEAPRDFRGFVFMLKDWWFSLPLWLRWFSAGGIVASALRFGFLILVLPPFVWDSLSYHLTNVGHWVQTGKIELFQSPIHRIYNPANYEAYATWFAVFVGHDVIIEAAGIPAYILAILAVYALARSLGLSRATAWMGALAYGATPGLIIAVTGTKNDPHMAAYFLTMLAILVDLYRRPSNAKPRNSLGQYSMLVLVFLTAFGTKSYIIHLTAGLVMIALVGAWQENGPGFWKAQLRAAAKRTRGMSRNERLELVALLAAGLTLGAYWNARNLALTGNPFYPYTVMLGGRQVFQGPESEFRFELGELGANLTNLAGKFGDWQDPIRPDLPNTTGWGWFSYTVGLPALAWTLFRRRRSRIVVVGLLTSFLFVFLSIGPSPWNMRFMIWFPAIFALSFAEVMEAFQRSAWRWASLGLVGFYVASLGLNFIMTLNYNKISANEFRSMLALPTLERHAALFRDNMPAEYGNAIGIVPADATLGYNVSGNGFVYPLYRADFSQQIVYIPFSAGSSCEGIAAAMASRGTRYLVVAPEHTPDQKIAKLRDCAASDTPIRERARGLYVVKR